jgi:hypothetical protein
LPGKKHRGRAKKRCPKCGCRYNTAQPKTRKFHCRDCGYKTPPYKLISCWIVEPKLESLKELVTQGRFEDVSTAIREAIDDLIIKHEIAGDLKPIE